MSYAQAFRRDSFCSHRDLASANNSRRVTVNTITRIVIFFFFHAKEENDPAARVAIRPGAGSHAVKVPRARMNNEEQDTRERKKKKWSYTKRIIFASGKTKRRHTHTRNRETKTQRDRRELSQRMAGWGERKELSVLSSGPGEAALGGGG
ncbi:hypothetical protein EVAR_100566_1 [Eumeta japonica]|uniref:Uncharacterized protein n=1 Tax=Eumeta variegata TaxID=151549 RepID=A0A4C1YA30_EUMVA|nr:hypothetical protein EVAR_100566_1 [Eumeta japonica]